MLLELACGGAAALCWGAMVGAFVIGSGVFDGE